MTVHAYRDTLRGMPRLSVPLLVLLVVVVSACGSDEDSAKEDLRQAGGGQAPAVRLIEAGAAPRKRLRFETAPGDRTSSTMTMKFAIDQALDGRPLPAQPVPGMKAQLVAEVVDVADSATTLGVTYGKAEAIASREVNPVLAKQFESLLESIEEIESTLVTAPTGAVLDATIETPESLDPALSATISQLTEQLRSLATPFPSEPVGIGARWKAESRLELSGLVTNQTQSFELKALEGDAYKLAVTLDQVFQPSELAGVDARVVGGRSTATGTLRGSLRTLMPLRSQLTSEGAFELAVSAGEGTERTLEQEIGVVVSLVTE